MKKIVLIFLATLLFGNIFGQLVKVPATLGTTDGNSVTPDNVKANGDSIVSFSSWRQAFEQRMLDSLAARELRIIALEDSVISLRNDIGSYPPAEPPADPTAFKVYDSVYPISHNQYYLVEENPANGDYVGYFHTNVTDSVSDLNQFYYESSYSFKIMSPDSTTFSINSNSGLITILDNSGINYGSDYNIWVKVTEGNREQYYRAYVHVADETNSTYINLGSSSGTGTKVSPHDNWISDVSGSMQNNHYYFIKRGSTCSNNDYMQINKSGSVLSNVYIGAYGAGVKPIFQGNSKSVVEHGIDIGSVTYADTVRDIKIYDIAVQQYAKSLVSVSASPLRINFERLDLDENSSVSGTHPGLYTFKRNDNIASNNVIRDCSITNSDEHNIKSTARGDSIINVYCYNATGNNISLNAHRDRYIRFAYVKTCTQYGIEQNTDYIDAQYFYSNGSYRGVHIYNDNNDAALHYSPNDGTYRDFLIENSSNDGFQVADFTTDTVRNILIERGKIRNAGDVAFNIRGMADSVVINHCEFLEWNSRGFNMSENVTDVYIHNCSFYETGASDVYIANSAANPVENLFITNTIYEVSVSSIATAPNNVRISVDGNPYVSSTDLHLKSSASYCINQGTNLNFVYDIESTEIITPDIGAYAYESEPQAYVPIDFELEGFGTESAFAYETTSTPTILIVDTLHAGSVQTGTYSGSFEWAIERTYPRIILFERGGVIDYETTNTVKLEIDDGYISVYGQTAPSPGITLKGASLIVDKTANDVLIQHIAVRFGDAVRPDGSAPQNDCMRIGAISTTDTTRNVVVDHCSFSWTQDEIISVVQAVNVTISNSMIYHPFHFSNHADESSPGDPEGHGMAFLIYNGFNLSVHKNYVGWALDRVPRLASHDSTVWLNNYTKYAGSNPSYFDLGNNDVLAFVSNALYPTPNRINEDRVWNVARLVDYNSTMTWVMNNDQASINADNGGTGYDVVEALTASETEFNNIWESDLASSPINLSNYDILDSDSVLNHVRAYSGMRPWDRDYYDSVAWTMFDADNHDFINSYKALPARAYNRSSVDLSGYWDNQYGDDGNMENGYDFSSDPASFTVNGTSISLNSNYTSQSQVLSALNTQLPAGTEAVDHPSGYSYHIIIQTTETGSSESIVIAGDASAFGIPSGTYTGEDAPYGNYTYPLTSHLLDVPANPHDDSGNGETNLEVWVKGFEE